MRLYFGECRGVLRNISPLASRNAIFGYLKAIAALRCRSIVGLTQYKHEGNVHYCLFEKFEVIFFCDHALDKLHIVKVGYKAMWERENILARLAVA